MACHRFASLYRSSSVYLSSWIREFARLVHVVIRGCAMGFHPPTSLDVLTKPSNDSEETNPGDTSETFSQNIACSLTLLLVASPFVRVSDGLGYRYDH